MAIKNKRVIFSFNLVLFFCLSDAFALSISRCEKVSITTIKLVERVKEIYKKNPSFDNKLQIASMHLIASINDKIDICERTKEHKSIEWGYWPRSINYVKDTFGDKEVKNTKMLKKGIRIYEEALNSKEKMLTFNDKVKLGWGYEKLGLTKKALNLFNSYKIRSDWLVDDELFYRNKTCSPKSLILRALNFSLRIYKNQSNKMEVEKTNKKIKQVQKYLRPKKYPHHRACMLFQ